MALDLAKEIGALMQQMLDLVARATADAGRGPLPKPVLDLHAVAHQLKGIQDELAAEQPGTSLPGAAPKEGGPAVAASHAHDSADSEYWGTAFGNRKTRDVAPAPPEPKPIKTEHKSTYKKATHKPRPKDTSEEAWDISSGEWKADS